MFLMTLAGVLCHCMSLYKCTRVTQDACQPIRKDLCLTEGTPRSALFPENHMTFRKKATMDGWGDKLLPTHDLCMINGCSMHA